MIYMQRMYIMEIVVKLARWGNSLAIRIPADAVENMSLKEGDEFELRQDKDEDKLELLRKKSVDELIDDLRVYRGRLPEQFKFDREEANER